MAERTDPIGQANPTTNTGITDDKAGISDDGKKLETNKEDKVEDFKTMWDNDDKEIEQQKQNEKQIANEIEQQKPDEAFDEHIKSLNLGSGIDANKIASDMAEGNTDSLNAAFTSVAASSYKAALISTNKLIDAKISNAIDEAVNRSEGKFKTNAAVRDLNDALPFTKAPEIAPIAKVVFGQFMKKGQNVDEAIESVRKFFHHTTKLSAKDVGIQMAKKSNSFSGSHSGITGDDLDEENETDFQAILSGLSN